MPDVSELLSLEIPSYGWIDWGTRFDDVVPHFPRWNVTTRGTDADCPDYAPGKCVKRSAIITTSGLVCGTEAEVLLNFCDNRLCAVHYFFDGGSVTDPHDFYELVECLRKRVAGDCGSPLMSTKISHHPGVSFRWSEEDFHVALIACEADNQELKLAFNNPEVCPACFRL